MSFIEDGFYIYVENDYGQLVPKGTDMNYLYMDQEEIIYKENPEEEEKKEDEKEEEKEIDLEEKEMEHEEQEEQEDQEDDLSMHQGEIDRMVGILKDNGLILDEEEEDDDDEELDDYFYEEEEDDDFEF